MKQILFNNKSSVSYDDSTPEEIKVYIDGKIYEFDEIKGDTPENRIEYANVVKREKYYQTLIINLKTLSY